jgi:hypothetical protein
MHRLVLDHFTAWVSSLEPTDVIDEARETPSLFNITTTWQQTSSGTRVHIHMYVASVSCFPQIGSRADNAVDRLASRWTHI